MPGGWGYQAALHRPQFVAPFGPSPGWQDADSGIIPGHLYIWEAGALSGDGVQLHCLLGDTPPKVIRGYGGYATTGRPGKRAVATWAGVETLAFSIDVLLENTVVHDSGGAAGKMRDLEKLCGLDRPNEPPPVVQWDGNAPHHDYSNAPQNRWVCETLEWGDMVFSDRATLLHAKATVVLGLYVSAQLPTLSRAKAFPRKTLRKGWDLRDFARHFLGDPKRWRDVAELNRDNPKCPTTPTFKAPHAVKLRVPPREGKAAKRG